VKKMSTGQNSKSSITGHLAAAAAYTIFALNIIFCKDMMKPWAPTPLTIFVFRSAGAAALFWITSLFLPREKVERRDLPRIALASFIGFFLCQLSFLTELPQATAIDIALSGNMSPVFTMLFAAIFIKEPLSVQKIAGVLVSMAGVVFIVLDSTRAPGGVEHTTAAGFILMLINVGSFAAYLGIFRPLIQKYNPVTFMKWIFLFALVATLPFAAHDIVTYNYAAAPASMYWELGYLIFMATFVAYFLIPVAQQRIRPTLVSMYSYVQPIIAAVIAVALGTDRLSWMKIVATLLVFVGVWVVNNSKKAGN